MSNAEMIDANIPVSLTVLDFLTRLFQCGFDFVIAAGAIHPRNLQDVADFAAFELETKIGVSGDRGTEISHHDELLIIGERQLSDVICSNQFPGVRIFARARFHRVEHQALNFCDVS